MVNEAASHLASREGGDASIPLEASPQSIGEKVRDAFDLMDEEGLLNHLRVELLRDLCRGFRDGTITHQEKAIVTRLLQFNNSRVKPSEDENLPEPGNKTELPVAGDPYQDDDFALTEGG